MKEPYYFYYHSVWRWYIGVINVNKGIAGSYLLKVQKLSISVYFITDCPYK